MSKLLLEKNKFIKQPFVKQGKNVKTPDVIEIENFNHPIFCFKHLHSNYKVSKCSDKQMKALLTKLEQLSQLSWNEIILAHKHGTGSEKIKKSSLKVKVPAFITDDVDFLLALRFDGMSPILVHRNRFIMHIIFIDHNMSTYNH